MDLSTPLTEKYRHRKMEKNSKEAQIGIDN
jgi:hypothetical protein